MRAGFKRTVGCSQMLCIVALFPFCADFILLESNSLVSVALRRPSSCLGLAIVDVAFRNASAMPTTRKPRMLSPLGRGYCDCDETDDCPPKQQINTGDFNKSCTVLQYLGTAQWAGLSGHVA